MNHELSSRIRQMPKLELHVHLEGSVTPSQLARLAGRHDTELAAMSVDEITRRFFVYRDFYAFLGTFKAVCDHLRTPEDYAQVFSELAGRLAAQNVLYAEILWTPSIARRNGVDRVAVFEGLLRAAASAREKHGLVVSWIFDCVRQWGAREAYETAWMAADYAGRGAVAFSVGGDEAGFPARQLAGIFTFARRAGLHTQAHAGEICGPESVWEMIEQCRVERISHGCRSIEDPELVEHLARSSTAIDTCLTSNRATGAVADLQHHPFFSFFERGLAVSLSTDDPGLFLTDLSSEYDLAASLFGLNWEQLCRLSRNAIGSSYLNPEEKEQMRQRFQGLGVRG